MQQGNDLSDFAKGQIYALKYIANFSKPRIASELQISENTIKKYLERQSKGQEGNDRARCGRKPCTDVTQDEAIISTSTANPFKSANSIKLSLGLQCHRKTVNNRLMKHGLFGRTPARKPELDSNSRDVGLQWSQSLLEWHEDE